MAFGVGDWICRGETSKLSNSYVGGKSTMGVGFYSGPCTPPNTTPHHYTFILTATDLEPNELPPGLTRDEVIAKFGSPSPHTKGSTGIVGLFVNPCMNDGYRYRYRHIRPGANRARKIDACIAVSGLLAHSRRAPTDVLVLEPLYPPDFINLSTAWSVNLYGGPLRLADQRRAIGEVTETFPLFASASGSPTICHTFFSAGILFHQRHGRPELDRIARKLRHVDHFSTCELIFDFRKPRLVDLLFCPSSLIFRILSKIGIVGDRVLNPPRDEVARPEGDASTHLQEPSDQRPSWGAYSSMFASIGGDEGEKCYDAGRSISFGSVLMLGSRDYYIASSHVSAFLQTFFRRITSLPTVATRIDNSISSA